MKSIFRSFLINTFAFWFISQILPGAMTFTKGYETLLLTALVLSLFNLLVRPFLNLLLLPINLLTLGTLRWLVNVGALFLITWIVPDFRIAAFYFSGLSFQGVIIPPFYFSLILAYVLVSFLLSFLIGLTMWVVK